MLKIPGQTECLVTSDPQHRANFDAVHAHRPNFLFRAPSHLSKILVRISRQLVSTSRGRGGYLEVARVGSRRLVDLV
jgi:hypothetical protein